MLFLRKMVLGGFLKTRVGAEFLLLDTTNISPTLLKMAFVLAIL
jgi:hypothetical protein